VRQLIERRGAKAHLQNGFGFTPIELQKELYTHKGSRSWQPMMRTLMLNLDGNAFLQGLAVAPN
jgi:hypothetical protein